MENNFSRVKNIIERLRGVIKCQKCLELKNEKSMLFYQECDHFFCENCNQDNQCCQICKNSRAKPTKVVNNKDILILYQSLSSFALPSKNEIIDIYKNHKESKELQLQTEDVVHETPKNKAKVKSRFSKLKEIDASCIDKSVKDETPNKEIEVVDKQKTPVTLKETSNIQTPLTTYGKKSMTFLTASAGSSKSNTSKININKRNPKGETQLHIACKKSNISMMEELIAAGANPNAKDNAGWTPLHDSIFSGNMKVIKFLLENGANVNMPGLENTTALHEAIAKGNIEIVKVLLEYGADVNLMNIFKETPMDLVTKYKLSEMKEILLEYSSKTKPSSDVKFEEPDQDIIVYCHNLEIEGEKLVNKFVDKFEVQVVRSVTLKHPPTHIIVGNDKFEITWAVISAVLAGSWIVTVKWVENSLQENSMKQASQYQPSTSHVEGFTKSRLNKKNQLPGLFSGCHFYFGGHFDHYTVKNVTVKKEDLKDTVEKQGGIIVKRCPDPESLALEKTIPFHASHTSSLCETSYYIVYQADKWDPKPKYNMSHMKTLPIDWLICCLYKFELVDPKGKETFCDFF